MQTLDWGFNLLSPVVYAQKSLGDFFGIPQIISFDCWSIILHAYAMEGRTRGLGTGCHWDYRTASKKPKNLAGPWGLPTLP